MYQGVSGQRFKIVNELESKTEENKKLEKELQETKLQIAQIKESMGTFFKDKMDNVQM